MYNLRVLKGEKHMDENENLLIPKLQDESEEIAEVSLRPKTLSEYIGQTKVKENMKVYIEAAKKRGEPLDHVLLYGPPGLRKDNTCKHYSYRNEF